MNRNKYRKTTPKKRSKRAAKRRLIIVSVVLMLAIVLAVITFFNLPSTKVNRAIAAGDKYTKEEDYQAAIESYQKALQIDETSVIAYSNIAGAYLSISDKDKAKEILREGWQNTQDESLLNTYHTIILDEAAAVIDRGEADLNTAGDILSVLKEDTDNAPALRMLDGAYEGIFENSYSYSPDALFRSDASSYSSENGSSVFSYDQYESFLKDLLSVYEATPGNDLKNIIIRYANPELAAFTIKYEDAVKYSDLISTITAKVGTDDSLSSLNECFTNAKEVQATFADIFSQLDVGNVDELRSFVVSDEYLALRDIFLHNEYTPQENTTYVPISREAMVLNNKDGKWSYRFLDFDENPETKGVITLWANFFEDNGVQRCAISYEPESVTGDYYPHTKYTVTYLKSYITEGNSTRVPRMNYRLDTTILTEDGNMDETVVGDWGGPNQWIMDLDAIEARIKA